MTLNLSTRRKSLANFNQGSSSPQAALLLWLPEEVKTALFIAYKPSFLPLALLESGTKVYLGSPYKVLLDSFRRELTSSSGLEICDLSKKGKDFTIAVDSAVIFGSPAGILVPSPRSQAYCDYLEVIRSTYSVIRDGGRLIVALESGLDFDGLLGFSIRFLQLLRARAVYSFVEQSMKEISSKNITHLKAFPGINSPILLYPHESPLFLKKLALRQTGYSSWHRFARLLSYSKRAFLPDCISSGSVHVLDK